MSAWNTNVLGDLRYSTPLTVSQREDLLLVILGASGITQADPEVIDDVTDRQLADPSSSRVWGEAAITFAYAAWRMLGDQSLGKVDVTDWLPVFARITETVHGVGVEQAGSTATSMLFAGLVDAARNPKSPAGVPDLDPDEFSVPAAILFAGTALQFTAARHPHAPRVKPGAKKLPPKVISLAESLARSIDAALAAGD